ncbi:MAG: hypothetical protein ACE5MG_04965 [Candidatus Methylomirabilales bacterium]
MRWLVHLILPFMMVVPVAAESPPEGTQTAPCTVPPRIADTRPDPEGVPTRVSVGLYVLDIAEINDVKQSFTTRFAVRVRWKDPRLAALAHCKLRLDEVWNPRLRFRNPGDLETVFADIVEIDPHGTVTYTQGGRGTLTVPLNLREFPFDRHVLPFTMITLEYGPEEVLLVVNERITGRAKTFSIPDWSIGPGATRVGTFYFAPQDRNWSRFDYEFAARRHAGFYIWKVIVPLMIFIFISWIVFWLDPANLGAQLGLSATVMVILVIFQLNLGIVLPRVSYLTRLDYFVLGSLVLVSLALVEAGTSGILAARGTHALAQRLDRWSRCIFPAAFFVLLAFALWA